MRLKHLAMTGILTTGMIIIMVAVAEATAVATGATTVATLSVPLKVAATNCLRLAISLPAQLQPKPILMLRNTNTAAHITSRLQSKTSLMVEKGS